MPVTASPNCYSSHLLAKADELHRAGFHAASLVIAQSACELSCEEATLAWLARRRADYLCSCVHSLVFSFNIASEKAKELYTALSGDPIQHEPFWQAYTDLVHKRNKVVHAGESVSAEEAERYLAVAKALASHLTDLSKAERAVEIELPTTQVQELLAPQSDGGRLGQQVGHVQSPHAAASASDTAQHR